jgi:probable O-glycosylation ligase (exosortase A-associated)
MKGLLFTLLLTYGGAVVALFRPFYGLLIYVAFAILRPESMWYWSVPPGNYSRIVAIAFLIGWALHGFGDLRLRKSKPVFYCFVGFWIWGLLSTLFAAVYPEWGFQWLINMGKILLPFVVGITLINSMEQVRQLAWTIGLSIGYLAYELNLAYYGGFNRLHWFGFGGMDNNCVAIELVTGVGFCFFLGYTADRLWKQLLAAASVLLQMNAIMFSFSRGGLLALIITGFAAFLLIPKRPIHFVGFALAVAAGIRLAGKEVLERFSTVFADKAERDFSAQSRLELWSNCVTLMRDNPFFGVGPDHFGYYAHVRFGWPLGKESHSLWFQTGAEMGVIGLALLIGFYFFCMAYLWPMTRDRYQTMDQRVRDMARMVIASLIGFMVASQFVSLEGLEMPYYVALVGAGILKVAPLHDYVRAPVALGAPAVRSQAEDMREVKSRDLVLRPS